MELRLLAIRHGETAWSRERRFAGSQDISLSPEGRRQCEAVARALASLAVAAVYVSPLARARESGEAVAAAQGAEIIVEPAFREMAFGDWEGLTRDEVARRFPEDYALWRTAPERFARPGSEPLAAVAARVAAGLAELRATHVQETVVLVSHAIVTRLLVLSALGLGPDRLWSVDASPAGISEIEYRGDWTTLHRVNTLAHLELPAEPDSRSATGSPGHPERAGGMGSPSPDSGSATGFPGRSERAGGLGGPPRPPIR